MPKKFSVYRGTGIGRGKSRLAPLSLVLERQMTPPPSKVGTAIGKASDGFPEQLHKISTDMAADLQAQLRTAAEAAYTKAATGRFARGLFAKATKDKTGTAIRVTFYNYREAKFLTQLSPYHHFQRLYPIAAYWIFAKGLGGPLWESDSAPPFEERRKMAYKIMYQKGTGRLSVPFQGVESYSKRYVKKFMGIAIGRHGKFSHGAESRRPIGEPTARLWVHHPGFKADVVADVALKVAQDWKSRVMNQAIVTWDPERLSEGIHIAPLPGQVSQITRTG